MKLLATFLLFSFMTTSTLIFDFNKTSNLAGWQVVDDVVMGGKSSGNLKLNSESHGVFFGEVSTENYGGFSSVRLNFKSISTSNKTHVVMRIKGDAKNYQFRIKNDQNLRYSYIKEFETTGDWETIKLPLKDFYPSFRGMKLEKPNFNYSQIEEIALLIGNKKNERFELILDSIYLD